MENDTKLTSQEARNALDVILDSEITMQKLSCKSAATYLLIWGAVYSLVPLLIFGFKEQATLLANGLVGLGVLATMIFGFRDPVKSLMGFRIGIFWWVIFSFAVIWIIILGGENFPKLKIQLDGRQVWAFGVTVAMLMFVLLGLIHSTKILIILGVGVTNLTLAGFFIAWDHSFFWFWMAICSGAPLLFTGLWLKLKS